MEHLTNDAIARLVEEAPDPSEAAHLERCDVCRSELEALVAQTSALRDLPALRPPPGDWGVLEACLASEGLIDPDRSRVLGALGTWAAFRRVAAGVILFAAGVGFGAQTPSAPSPDPVAIDGLGVMPVSAPRTLEEAVQRMERYGALYQGSIRSVQALQAQGQSFGNDPGDPVTRLAAIQTMITANRVALREYPTDPLFNQTYLHLLEQRDQVTRRLSVQGEEWYE